MSVYDVDGNELNALFSYTGSSLTNAYDKDGEIVFPSDWNPVALHGKLKKSGLYLVDKNNVQYQLRGIGTHALLQYTNLHTLNMVRCLKEYGVNCIRISAYLSNFNFKYSDGQSYQGYIAQPEATKSEIDKIVGYCIAEGIYCIIDWHTMSDDVSNGEIAYQTEAVAFWDYFAQKYADVPNVIYELQNEPFGASQANLGAYVKAEHDKILEYATDPVMIVGCLTGSITNTVNALTSVGINDVFYSQHFYDDDLSAFYSALSYFGNTYPSVISEWSNANVNGNADADSGGDNENVNGFMDRMYARKISNSSWKLTDQNHVFSVLKYRGALNSSYYSDGFTDSDLTAWGKLFFDNMRRYKQLAP